MKQKLKNTQIQYLKYLYDGIKQRCYNSNNPAYKNYGGRDIKLSSEWQGNRKKFIEDILSNLGHRPSENYQLDRIDVNGNYEQGNLRWVTSEENNKNKRTNRLIKINGEEKILTEWTKQSGISQQTILWRIENGWAENRWLEPIKKNKKNFDNSEFRAIHFGIKDRCYNPKSHIYQNYGGRGIFMSQEWIDNYPKFKEDILNCLGPRPSQKHQLDRINVNGNYEIFNLRWATPKENCRNKRNNNLIEIEGIVKTLIEWSEISGVKRSTIQKRLKLGYVGKDLLNKNNQIKFNKEEVQNIKKLSKQLSMRALAKQFNCGHTTILDILHDRGAYKITGENK